MSFLLNWFRSKPKMDSELGYYTPTSGCPDAPQKKPLVHVRAGESSANLQFVSAQDALGYMLPSITNEETRARISKLPRAAQIKAYWPDPKNDDFIAVAFENLPMLMRPEDGTAQELQAMAQCFKGDCDYANSNVAHSMILVTDARRTQTQLRFERDVRDRVLHKSRYYENKRKLFPGIFFVFNKLLHELLYCISCTLLCHIRA